MKTFVCLKCGYKMEEEVAPDFCPNCGCKSSNFIMLESPKNKIRRPVHIKNKLEDTKKNGCSFWGCAGIGALVLIIGFIMLALIGNSGGGSTHGSSVDPKIYAKNLFVDDCIKKNMHDPKSYKEVNNVVSYDIKNEEYIVTVTFRGNNAFGQSVLSTCKGGVKFSDNYNRYKCRIITE